MANILIVAALLLSQYNGEYYRDFRSRGFDEIELRLVGTDESLKVKGESGGLRITIPHQKSELRPIGFVPQFRVSGDFEITLTYEIVSYEEPTSGNGVGISLYVSMDSSSKEAAHFARTAMVGGAQLISTTRLSTLGGKRIILSRRNFPISAMTGKLRLTRTGSTLHYSVATLDDDNFHELHQDEFGTRDLTTVRVAAENGSSTHAVDVRILEFRVQAKELPGPSSAKPPSGWHLIWWSIGIFIGLGSLALVWYLQRFRTD